MDILPYLKEAIKLELNASELYLVFAQYNKEDYNFWMKLAMEEQNHASILKTAVEIAKITELPGDYMGDINDLIKVNEMIPEKIKEFKKNPAREQSFILALKLESSAGETHFQEAMSDKSPNKIVQILQKLNQEDENHYSRILEYFKTTI